MGSSCNDFFARRLFCSSSQEPNRRWRINATPCESYTMYTLRCAAAARGAALLRRLRLEWRAPLRRLCVRRRPRGHRLHQLRVRHARQLPVHRRRTARGAGGAAERGRRGRFSGAPRVRTALWARRRPGHRGHGTGVGARAPRLGRAQQHACTSHASAARRAWAGRLRRRARRLDASSYQGGPSLPPHGGPWRRQPRALAQAVCGEQGPLHGSRRFASGALASRTEQRAPSSSPAARRRSRQTARRRRRSRISTLQATVSERVRAL